MFTSPGKTLSFWSCFYLILFILIDLFGGEGGSKAFPLTLGAMIVEAFDEAWLCPSLESLILMTSFVSKMYHLLILLQGMSAGPSCTPAICGLYTYHHSCNILYHCAACTIQIRKSERHVHKGRGQSACACRFASCTQVTFVWNTCRVYLKTSSSLLIYADCKKQSLPLFWQINQ